MFPADRNRYKRGMKYVLWLVVVGGGMYGAWTYANQTVPGGESRIRQFVRLKMEQRSGGGMPSLF